ncbi:MAG: hypothetical protein HYT39_00725 [Candidatus Sungbacteria bacterium]|nr:hypothetical protein [Candidatus Sungbacteria bacterium]
MTFSTTTYATTTSLAVTGAASTSVLTVSGASILNGNVTLGQSKLQTLTLNAGRLDFINAATSTVINDIATAWSIATSTTDITPILVISTASTTPAGEGAVGIGTSSPVQHLSVSGNAYFTGGLGVGAATSTNGNFQLTGDAQIGTALSVGGIASFGNTITGTVLNSTTGINTGAGAGTQRIDSSGNLSSIGTISASGLATLSGGILANYASSTIRGLFVDMGTTTYATSTSLAVTGYASTSALTVSNLSTLMGGILSNYASSTIRGLFVDMGTTTYATSTSLAVTGAASTSALTVSNTSILNGNVTLGATSAQTLTANASSTFANSVALNGDIAMGNAIGDRISISAGLVNYGNNSTTTIPNNFVNAWSIATSTGVMPILSVSTFSGTGLASSTSPGRIGIGTTTPEARLSIDSRTASDVGIAGIHEVLTIQPTAGGTQFGNRLVVVNSSQFSANTMVGQFIRVVDDSGLANTVRGLEIQSNSGTTTLGVNTGLYAQGKTFGVQGISTGVAGGSLIPAEVYAEIQEPTQGQALRVYTATTTTSDLALFFQEGSQTFSGTGLKMNFHKGAGTFTGNFLDLQDNDTSKFRVTASGNLEIGNGSICVDSDGSCTASTSGGAISANRYNTGSADIAENYFSNSLLEKGDIVSTKGGLMVDKAENSTDPIIGVVSTKPGIVLGEDEDVTVPGASAYPIALAGRVPVKVSDENGTIKIGDKLQLSSLTGIGMKYLASSTGVTVIGVALEDFDGTNYLSEVTVKVETEKKILITEEMVPSDDTQDYSGGEGGTSDQNAGALIEKKSVARLAASTTIEKIFMPPANSPAQDANISPGRTVKVGKVMVFVTLGWSRLDERISQLATSGTGQVATNGWSVDQSTGKVNVNFYGDVSLSGNNLINVKKIVGADAKFVLDETGKLVVKEIEADAVRTKKLEIGDTATPAGIILYDQITKEPYCVSIANGEFVKVAGVCGAVLSPPPALEPPPAEPSGTETPLVSEPTSGVTTEPASAP